MQTECQKFSSDLIGSFKLRGECTQDVGVISPRSGVKSRRLLRTIIYHETLGQDKPEQQVFEPRRAVQDRQGATGVKGFCVKT